MSLKGNWHGRRNWPKHLQQLPPWFSELIEPLRQSALFLYDQLRRLTDQIETTSSRPRPKGMGALTEQFLEREVCDWNRFKNRKQVFSYLGLCPSEKAEP